MAENLCTTPTLTSPRANSRQKFCTKRKKVGIDPDAISAAKAEHSAGKIYNLQGVEVGDGYKGVVIKDRKKILKR